MDDAPKKDGNVITFTLRVEEDKIATEVKYNLEDVAKEDLPFCHALMDGVMILMAKPHKVAKVAMKASKTAKLFHDIQQAAYTGEPEATGTPDNVVRLH